jgi:hypothetical protein
MDRSKLITKLRWKKTRTEILTIGRRMIKVQLDGKGFQQIPRIMNNYFALFAERISGYLWFLSWAQVSDPRFFTLVLYKATVTSLPDWKSRACSLKMKMTHGMRTVSWCAARTMQCGNRRGDRPQRKDRASTAVKYPRQATWYLTDIISKRR